MAAENFYCCSDRLRNERMILAEKVKLMTFNHRYMSIEKTSSIEAVGEHEIDFTIAQLLETSPQFRRRLVSDIIPQLNIDEYLGTTIHASYASEGESDIEFGFLTETEDRHLVLVENKIDAVKQPNQIERYYNRGQFRVDQGDWDTFTVCLLAPENYVSTTDTDQVDSTVHYEAILDHLKRIDHDSTEFFQNEFEAAMRKSITDDASETVLSIAEKFQSEIDLDPLQRTVSGKKRLTFKSTDPKHPDAVQYDVYVVTKGDEGHTNVRLQIANVDGLTEAERDTIKSILSQNTDLLPSFEWTLERKKNIAVKTVWHSEISQRSTHDSHVDAAVDELLLLTEAMHPLLISKSIC